MIFVYNYVTILELRALFSLQRDVRCGKLYCSGGRNLPMIGSMAIRVTISDRYLCKGIGSSSNKSDSMDPGIVRSGTTCGYNKVNCSK